MDGRLYVNDSVFANNPSLKAREYIKATYFSGVDGARTINAWTDSSYTLSNPSQRETLGRLNKIKGREMWRPLAPSILREKANLVLRAYRHPVT